MEKQKETMIDAVVAFAEICRYEREHSHQVAKLALLLFDELKELHGLGEKEGTLLNYAAVLHDIGWLNGRKGHHKAACDMIMAAPALKFSDEERVIVALVARYHRKSLPVDEHKYFGDLNADGKNTVRKLAALLRVADGLDRRHISSVEDLQCRVQAGQVAVRLKVKNLLSDMEKDAALQKSDLFKEVFRKEIVLEVSA